MKLVYLGTPQIAVPPLNALIAAGHTIEMVITGADRRRGRGSKTSPSPVKQAALDHGLTVSHTIDDILTTDAELGVVVAFGQIIKSHILDQLDLVNLHFSLLPRWRGAAPVERAILAGDTQTGVAVMAVETGLDTGAVYAQTAVPIGDHTTAAELAEKLVDVGSELLVATLTAGLNGPRAQTGEPVYAHKLSNEERRIDWSQPPIEIYRLIRIGGAWTTFRGERFKIHTATLVDGQLRPVLVQPAGKPQMNYDDWRNGAQPAPGEDFE